MLRTLFAASLALTVVLVACASAPATTGTTGSGGSGSTGTGTGTGAGAGTGAGTGTGTGTGTGAGGMGTGGAPIDAGMDAPACKLASPFSSSNAVCNGCAEDKCCAQINGCLLDPACNDDYVNCTLVCAFTDFDGGADAGGDAGTAGCLADCAQQFPKGKAEYDTAFGCADTVCATECQ